MSAAAADHDLGDEDAGDEDDDSGDGNAEKTMAPRLDGGQLYEYASYVVKDRAIPDVMTAEARAATDYVLLHRWMTALSQSAGSLATRCISIPMAFSPLAMR